MEVFTELNENKGIALALGYFDGIHIGHRKIIQTLVKKAKAKGYKSAVITFSKNPSDYFYSQPTLNIQTFKDKEILLSSLGVDYLYELDFEQLKDLTAEEYFKNIIIKYFEPKLIVVGYNHSFGKGREGNGAFLEQRALDFGYDAVIVPEEKYDKKEKISSSIIREKIEKGHLNTIKAFLGRHFSVRNSVISGSKVARGLGYPTANIIWPNSMVKLPYGVYLGFCQINVELKPALICWGNKPTLTDGKEEIIETHIFHFNENLYGKIIKVLFVEKIRGIQSFKNIKELNDQIKKDHERFIVWAKRQ